MGIFILCFKLLWFYILCCICSLFRRFRLYGCNLSQGYLVKDNVISVGLPGKIKVIIINSSGYTSLQYNIGSSNDMLLLFMFLSLPRLFYSHHSNKIFMYFQKPAGSFRCLLAKCNGTSLSVASGLHFIVLCI